MQSRYIFKRKAQREQEIFGKIMFIELVSRKYFRHDSDILEIIVLTALFVGVSFNKNCENETFYVSFLC
jgi:hypothetical protein